VRILIFNKVGRPIDILRADENFVKYKNGKIIPSLMYTGGEQCPNFKIYYHDEYLEQEG